MEEWGTRAQSCPRPWDAFIPPSQLVTYSKSPPCKSQPNLGTHGLLLVGKPVDLASWVTAAARLSASKWWRPLSFSAPRPECCSIRMRAGLFGLPLPDHSCQQLIAPFSKWPFCLFQVTRALFPMASQRGCSLLRGGLVGEQTGSWGESWRQSQCHWAMELSRLAECQNSTPRRPATCLTFLFLLLGLRTN